MSRTAAIIAASLVVGIAGCAEQRPQPRPEARVMDPVVSAPLGQPGVMPGGPAGQVAGPVGGQCEAGPVAGVVGRSVSAVSPQDLLARSGAGTIRMLREGQPVTREFNGGRLNLVLDAGGRISQVYCG